MEKRAPELAIRDGPEARLELLAHHIRDILVLQLLQIRCRALPCCKLFAGRQNLLGPEERPNLIRAIDACWKWHVFELIRRVKEAVA